VPLHRLTQIVMGVPNVEQTASYYADFGLPSVPGEQASEQGGDHTFATVDGGEQPRIVSSPRRRLVQLGIGADDPDGLDRVAISLAALDVAVERTGTSVRAVDPGTDVTVCVEISAPPTRSSPSSSSSAASGSR
jgi:hypothetical protein